MALSSENWLKAQYSVLGAALIEKKLVSVVIAETEDSDYSGTCRLVFQAMRAAFTECKSVDDIDVVVINNKLGGKYTDFLMQLMEITPTAANIESYIKLCKEQSRAERLRQIGEQLSQAATLAEQRPLLEQANTLMVDRPGLRIVTMEMALIDFFEDLEKGPPDYLQWPFPQINDEIFVEPGDFVIIGGYPSSGKTAFALQCAWQWAKKYRVGFFSYETGTRKLTHRRIADFADIPLRDLKRRKVSGSKQNELASRDREFSSHEVELISCSGRSVAEIRAIAFARRFDVVILDYLQIIPSHGSKRYDEMTNLSMELHNFAQQTNTIVIALSQLTRNSGAEPGMHSLRESGQFEQDADLILLLYKPDADADAQRTLSCVKNKEGELFNILLDFDGSKQRFSKNADPEKTMGQFRRMDREKKQYARDMQMKILPPYTAIPAEFTRDGAYWPAQYEGDD